MVYGLIILVIGIFFGLLWARELGRGDLAGKEIRKILCISYFSIFFILSTLSLGVSVGVIEKDKKEDVAINSISEVSQNRDTVLISEALDGELFSITPLEPESETGAKLYKVNTAERDYIAVVEHGKASLFDYPFDLEEGIKWK